MSSRSESPSEWRPRQRIRPKRYESSPDMRQQTYQQSGTAIGGPDAKTHGPRGVDSGLACSSTRSLKLLFARPHINPSPPAARQTIGASVSDKAAEQTPGPPELAPARLFTPAAAAAHLASASVPPALLVALFPSNHCIAIRHEYLLQMSKKSKRMGRAGPPGGGFDIMDSLVSSIDEIESKQMRGAGPLSNGHRRQVSDEFQSVIMVSPAPVIQTSKSSTRNSGSNKLSKRSSPRNSIRENTRLSLRSSSSQEHWLPPIEQEEDFFSVPTGRRSYSSSPSNNTPAPHPSIPTRSTSIHVHDIPTASIPQRANSLLHPPVSASMTRQGPPRRSETSDIPSYIHRYLRERNDSKENLSLDIPKSPRRSPHPPRTFPSRSRNSTTAIPANDNLQRHKLVTKRQSSQGFERDLSATRHFYSLPSPTGPRRSASLKPSRSSVGSDRTSMSGVNSNYVQEVLSNPKLTQRIRLTSGRILSFSEVCPLS